MDKYRTPGKSSSNAGANATTLELQLQRIAAGPEIELINGLLGESANLHIVGGTIRELARGQEVSDLDLATCLTPQIVMQQLAQEKRIKIIPTGLGHGTLTLLINEQPIELTTFRQPGSRAENNFSDDILTDLSGRDFTCNALAYDVNQKILLDPYCGQKHIENRKLIAVGNARTRLLEDPVRMLRMVRFGSAIGFDIDQELLTATSALADQIATVSIERIRSEFEKILVAEHVAESMRTLIHTNLFQQFLPEVIPSVGFEQNDFHIHDVFEHTLWVMQRSPRELTLRLAAFFHDIGKPASLSIDEQGRRHFYEHEQFSVSICKNVMERLKFSHALTERVCLLVAAHMRPLLCSPKAVRRVIRDVGDALPQWKLLKRADRTPKQSEQDFELELQSFEEQLAAEDQRLYQTTRSGLCIDGHDLMVKLGIESGPQLGKVLKQLEEAILDEPGVNTPDQLLALARQLM